MSKEQKKVKGEYGYRQYHRKLQLAKVLAGVILILLQLALRSLSDHVTFKTVLTISAILSVLPVANLSSPLIASWKYKTPGLEFYKKVKSREVKSVILYDLIITSKDAIMPMDAIAVHPTGIFAYCTASKLNLSEAEKFLNIMLHTHNLELPVKIIQDEHTFFSRLDSLKPYSQYGEDEGVDSACSLLKSLSM